MTEGMRKMRNACVERGNWLTWDEMTSTEKRKVDFVITDLRKLLIDASAGEIEQVFYNVVEIAGGRDEYVSVYTYHEMLAFIDVTGDSLVSLARDVLRQI